jgi:hypothetical protein
MWHDGNDQNDEHIVERFVITNIELIKEYEQKEKRMLLASIMQAGIG